MKRICLYLITLIIVAFSASAQSTIEARKFFEANAKDEGVTSVYISKSLISMIPNTSTKGLDIYRLSSKINYIYILSTDNPKATERLSDKVKSAFANSNYEQLFDVNSADESSAIYYRKGKNGENEYIIVSRDAAEFTVILIAGTITPADVQGMV